jgi:hypothetical protein
MAVATGLAVVGIAVAASLYRRGPDGARGVVGKLGGLYEVVYQKFYVDELVDGLVRGFRAVAHGLFNLIDRFVIDMVLVNGSATVIGLIGRLARAWQNGDVQRYLLAMLIGLAAIVYFATRTGGSFSTVEEPGNTVRFSADVGDGVERKGAKVEWDFTGDDRPDAFEPETTWTYASPGEYHVVLRVTDVFGDTKVVKRSVKVGGRPQAPDGDERSGSR